MNIAKVADMVNVVDVVDVSGRFYPTYDNVKGTILGATAAPLFLMSIYFYKASPAQMSKEHIISMLAYVCALSLVYIGVMWYKYPIIITSMQVLPVLNQIFVGSFILSFENCLSIFLCIVSIYTACIGYYIPIQVYAYTWYSIMIMMVCIAIAIYRMVDNTRSTQQHIGNVKLSDFTCMLLFTFESAAELASLCALSVVLGSSVVVIGLITSMCFMHPVEKALYYYPATAVIPFFTIMVRVLGALLAYRMYAYESQLLIIVSVLTGICSALFPIVLAQ